VKISDIRKPTEPEMSRKCDDLGLWGACLRTHRVVLDLQLLRMNPQRSVMSQVRWGEDTLHKKQQQTFLMSMVLIK